MFPVPGSMRSPALGSQIAFSIPLWPQTKRIRRQSMNSSDVIFVKHLCRQMLASE
jgi:hypothetical protein